MNKTQTTSLSEVTLTEAIARRLDCYLILRPFRPSAQKHLRSRFLALTPEAVILQIPSEGDEKVFVPAGCDLGLIFTLGDQVFQARSKVLGQVLHTGEGGRRFDALQIQPPAKLLPLQKRTQPRWTVPGDRLITARAWPAEALLHRPVPTAKLGQVVDWSHHGLGLRFLEDPGLSVETDMIVCLEEGPTRPRRFYRGRVRHITGGDQDGFLMGLSNVSELMPGQAVEIMRALAGLP